MRSNLDLLEGNKVKISVELDDDEFDAAVDAAFRRLAREVKIPGFRPGKAPRRLLEVHLGTDAARREALRESLPDFYEKAVKELDVEPIAPPDFDITAGREEGPVAFEAVVEVMPEIHVGGYEGLRVTLPNFDVSEEEIDQQVDKLREQFGQLQAVNRPAADGDHVSVDRKVTRHDDTLLAVEDELHEVGRNTIAPELDDQLRGAKVGDILKFNATVPDHDEVTFQILVKSIREKALPEVTDEWASEASEFETVEELRGDIRRRIDAVRRLEAALSLRDKVAEALSELVDDEVPETLVEPEFERRIQSLAHRLEHQNIDFGLYLQAIGKSQDDLIHQLREDAVRAVKVELGLRAIADAEGIEATEDDVEQEVAAIAERVKEKPATVRRRLEHEDRIPAVRSGIRKSKALEWLIEHTEYVDEEGRVIDRSELEASIRQGPEIPYGPAKDQTAGDPDSGEEPSDTTTEETVG